MPLALLAIVVAWNVYIAFNDHGIIEGEVRDRAGAPVAGATVIFFERNFVYYEEKQRATTDAQGVYRFTDMKTHVGQLEARTADGRKSRTAPAAPVVPLAGHRGSRRWLSRRRAPDRPQFRPISAAAARTTIGRQSLNRGRKNRQRCIR